MNFKNVILLSALSFAGTSLSAAIVGLAGTIVQLENAAATPVPNGTLGLVVVDTSGDGAFELSAGSIGIGDTTSGDQIVARLESTTSAFPSVGANITANGQNIDNTGLVGDPYAIFWLPGLSIASTVVAQGQSYGFETHTNAIIPSSGNVTAWNANGGPADLTAVPEPAFFGLVTGVCAAWALIQRRRKL